jgi:hypothetical protein
MWKRCAHDRRFPGGELDTLESICPQALVARQAFEAGPRTAVAQIDQVVEIQIYAQPGDLWGAIIEEAGTGAHL